MRKEFTVSALAFLILVTNGVASALPISDELKPHVRKSYHSSNLAPIYLIFESYLQTLQGRLEVGEFEGLDYVVDTLNFGHTPDGERRASELVSIFDQAYERLSAENVGKKHAILCSIDPASRSDAEVVRAFNTLDNTSEVIAKKYFRETSKKLNRDERRRLEERLKEIRVGFYYVSFDYESLFDSLPVSPRHQLATTCAMLEATKYYVQ